MRDTEADAKEPRHSVSISSLIWNSLLGESDGPYEAGEKGIQNRDGLEGFPNVLLQNLRKNPVGKRDGALV